MLHSLTVKNVGPAERMELQPGERLNIFTGDNGLGKSFLLDVIWFALTRSWPAAINPHLQQGFPARPASSREASIAGTLVSRGDHAETVEFASAFRPDKQAWVPKRGHTARPPLVLYYYPNGDAALYDPARNYWSAEDAGSFPPLVFTASQLWNGLLSPEGKTLCNGLLEDWAGWQKENGEIFGQLKAVLRALSPGKQEVFQPGKLTRVSVEDVRDVPTIRMPYGREVPVVFVSSALKRMISVIYLMVWSWQEHQKAAQLRQEEPVQEMVLLIDELEAHLHPRWQRSILNALLQVSGFLSKDLNLQMFFTTHAPLIMASAEPVFDPDKDRWFDFDLVRAEENEIKVQLAQRAFRKRGEMQYWATSDAFDLPSTRSKEAETLIAQASKAADAPDFTQEQYENFTRQLVALLDDTDPFLRRWRYLTKDLFSDNATGTPAT